MFAVKRQRGSVILLVIGLLTVIAMLGSMLLLVARLDRQTSQAIATVAPEFHVAQGVLDRLLAERLADLYIDDKGNADPNDDVAYGKVSANRLVAERQMIDYPATGYDDALACIELNPATGRWDHITDPNALGFPLTWAATYQDVPLTDPNLVDTDGDGTGDSYLFPTGVFDRDGSQYYAAVRMIDASGLLNVSTAGLSTRQATWGQVMDASDIAMAGMTGPPPLPGNDILSELNRGPFDFADMLALRWLGDPNGDPNTVSGRLIVSAGGDFMATRGSLTIASSYKAVSPLWTYASGGASQDKLDPNTPTLNNLYDAFLGLLDWQKPDPGNPLKAALLAVNLWDYTDWDGSPSQFIYPGGTVYGIERHPFVSKVFLKRIADSDGNEILPPVSALELINPYVAPIPLEKYGLVTSGGTVALTGKSIPGNGMRFVVRSDLSVKLDLSVPADSQLVLGTLDVRAPVKLIWRHPTQGWEACVDESPAIVESQCPKPTDPNGQHWCAIFRDDDLTHARYSLYGTTIPVVDANAPDYTAGAQMGVGNPVTPPDDGVRCPVYVRNGPLVNVGEMMRLMTVGPTETVPLTVLLSNTPVDDRQLIPFAPSVPADTVPLGCALSEFFTVIPPDPNYSVQGLININTAPASVLGCLPALSAPGAATVKNRLISDIIAYRDEAISPATGRDYHDRTVFITGLRNQPQAGFACSGEIAIPMHLALGGPINNYDPNNMPPRNYAVGQGPFPNDDGIPVPGVVGDPIKDHVLYTWLSNQVTVRSNTYIAYIRVQLGGNVDSPARNYVAVIDRGNCNAVTDRPRVLMFTELR